MSVLRLRGGGDVGPPLQVFGPVNGAQWVRDNAVPQAVTQPAGAVTVNPGGLTQAVLNNNPGATFWITKGTHTITSSLTPLANQKFYLESPAGITRNATNTAVLDAGGANLSGYILGDIVDTTIPGVEIYGGLWRNLGTVQATGNDSWRSPILNSGASGWICQDVEVGPTNQTGITDAGANFTWRRLYVHDCGFYGLDTSLNIARTVGGLMEHCHLKANSKVIHGTANDAGQKFLRVDGATWRYNWVEQNEGSGMWWDFQHKDHLIHDNVIEDCWDWGLFYEFSFGGTEIRNNYLRNNAEHYGSDSWFNAVQLLVGSTDATLGSPSFSEVRVHNNWLDGTSKQMGVLENLGRPHPRNCRFYDNRVDWRGTNSVMELAGAESNDSTDVYQVANGNTFEGNQYHVVPGGLERWQWIGATGSAGQSKTWEQWKAYGHDVPDGTLTVDL